MFTHSQAGAGSCLSTIISLCWAACTSIWPDTTDVYADVAMAPGWSAGAGSRGSCAVAIVGASCGVLCREPCLGAHRTYGEIVQEQPGPGAGPWGWIMLLVLIGIKRAQPDRAGFRSIFVSKQRY